MLSGSHHPAIWIQRSVILQRSIDLDHVPLLLCILTALHITYDRATTKPLLQVSKAKPQVDCCTQGSNYRIL